MNGSRPEGLQAGFTYVSVLALVVIMGIAMSGGATCWRTVMKREREASLFFCGDQYFKAIRSYAQSTPGNQNPYPARLEDLLKDPRFPTIRRHIRKLYPDPMTPGGTWGLILGKDQRIQGVYSKSGEVPMKQGNFPQEYVDFQEAKTYSDWRFEYRRQAPATETEKRTPEGKGDTS